MSKHTWNQNDTTGYFLPEDSQFRLKKLHAHMVFLSGLAQPRTHDEDDTGFSPEISGDDMAVCLEVLAEQAERVLDEVTWPAERAASEQPARAREQGDAREAWVEVGEGVAANGHEDDEVAMAADVQDDDAGEATLDGRQADALAEAVAVGLQNDGEAGGPDAVADASDADAPLVFGMTLDQLDTLNRMHDRLRAYGDLVFGIELTDVADGTLTALGDVIFEEAGAASELMDQVARQSLRVREVPTIYGVPVGPGLSREAAVPRLPPPADRAWSQASVTRH